MAARYAIAPKTISVKWHVGRLYLSCSRGKASASARLIKRVGSFAFRSRRRRRVAGMKWRCCLSFGDLDEVYALHIYKCSVSNMETCSEYFPSQASKGYRQGLELGFPANGLTGFVINRASHAQQQHPLLIPYPPLTLSAQHV